MTTNTCEKISCKHCSSTAIVKYGTAPSVSGKRRQRYLCCVCNRTFVDGDRRYAQDRDKRIGVVVREYTDRKSLRGAARSANISATTAMRWLVNVANELPDVDKAYEKATEDEDPDIDRDFIFDEMWHFIEESTNKLWIIKLYDSNNNYLVDFELGGRDEETFLKLYNRISNNYKKCYYVDNWQTFTKVLTDNSERHLIGKEYTYPIEQHNSNTRHYLARFHRRTKIVSRRKEMVAISIKLVTLRYEHPHLMKKYLTPLFPKVGSAA